MPVGTLDRFRYLVFRTGLEILTGLENSSSPPYFLPYTFLNMPKRTETEVSRMNEACEYAQSLKKPNLSQIAREFGVPYKTLYNRIVKGHRPATEQKPVNKVLNEYQEKGLTHWVKTLDASFIPPTASLIEQFANDILARSDTPERTVGKDWVYRYMNRFPDRNMKLRRQNIVDSKRISEENVALLRHWYSLLAKRLEGVPPRLIYNFDETGFQLGQGRSQRVFSSRSSKSQTIACEDHGERVTVAECIAADGWKIEPLIIFRGRHQMESWYDISVPPTWMTSVAERGYIVDELALCWIKEFDAETRYRVGRDEKRVLILDGCGSHLTFEFLSFAEKKNIIIFGLPPNNTHYLQPLDGKPFLTYKTFFRQHNNLISQWGRVTACKTSFLQDLISIRDKSLISRIIRNSFKERGIYPVNGDLVCLPLEEKLPPIPDITIDLRRTPSPAPENLLSSSVENTPSKSLQDAEKRRKKLLPIFEKDSLTPKDKRHIQQLLDDQMFYVEALANTSLTIAKMAKIQAPRKKQTTRRHIMGLSNDGITRVRDANRSIAERKAKEAEKEERRMAKEFEKRYGVRPPTEREMPQITFDSRPILGEDGEIIGYFDTPIHS